MFSQINADCQAAGESVVDFSDVEYYATQISAIFDGSKSDAECMAMATELRDFKP